MRNPVLKSFENAGIFPVTIDADRKYTSPYSGTECLWYDSCVKDQSQILESYTHLERSEDDLLCIKTDQGTLELCPKDLNPYLSPSYSGQQIIDNEEVLVEEYIIEAHRRYYAEVTSFEAHLPPVLLIPKSQKVYLLNLYDEYPEKGKHSNPLIPTFRGRTG